MTSKEQTPHGQQDHHQGDDRASWDSRYGTDQVWSGAPNQALVTELTGAAPGRALDVGCGEGADAIRLAQQGWQVTAVDISGVAVERAQAAADRAGVQVDWQCRDLLQSPPDAGEFDLVSAFYAPLTRLPDAQTERLLLEAVAPGGTLLFVTHAHVDLDRAREHGFDPASYIDRDGLLAAAANAWEVIEHGIRERSVSGGGGAEHTADIVLRLRRS